MSTINIGVPAERYRQLQRLAEIDQCSIADTIGDFINKAIHEERLPDELPGWTIERVGDHVRLVIEDAGIERKLTPSAAFNMADTLERLAVPTGTMKGIFDVDTMLRLERRGTSVKIIDVNTSAYRAVARSVAQDAAHLLRASAA